MALQFLNDGYFTGKVGIGTESPVSTWLSGFDPSTGNGTFKLTSEGWIVTPYLTGLAGYYPGQGARPIVWADNSGTNIQCWDNTATDGISLRSSNGTTRLFVKENGNVGIGTTSPGSKLEIAGANSTTNATALFSIQKNEEGYGLFSGLYGSGASWLQSGTADGTTDYSIVMQPNGGNVGIGTTSPTNGKLVIDSTGFQASLETGTAGDGRLNIGHFSNGTFIGTYGDDGGAADLIRFGTHSGDERMRISSAGAIKFNAYGAGTLVTDASGNITAVGSGGAGPFLPLSGGTMTGTNGVVLPDNFNLKIGTGSDLQIYHSGTESKINNDVGNLSITNFADDSDIIFSSDNGSGATTPYLVLDGSTTHAYFSNPGNVGIGTTSPSAKLVISGGGGAISDNGFQINSGYGHSGTGVLEINPSAASHIPLSILSKNGQTANLVNVTSFGGTAGNLFNVQSSGNVGIGVTNPVEKLDVYQSNAGFGVADFSHVNGNRILINPGYNYYDAYNHIFRGLNGTDTHMTIDLNGNVGIGTTSPGAALEVRASASSPFGALRLSTSSTKYWQFNTIYNNTDPDLFIAPNGGAATMTLQSTGNVGIGTASIGTNDKLLIKTSVDNSVAQGLVIQRSANTDEGYINYNGGGFQFRSTDGDPVVFGQVSNERMRIDPSGNVGIGTTSPTDYGATANTLEVRGASGTGSGLIRVSNAGNTVGAAFYSGSTSSTLGTQTAHPLYLSTNNSTKMTISSGGNVGIGTTPFASGLTNTVLDLAPVASVWGFSNSAYLNANAYHNGSWLYKSTASAGVLQIDGNSLTFRQAASGTVDTGITFDQPFVISEEGNVGIGTTNPIGKLEVQSSVVRTSVNGGADELVLQNAGYSGMTILANSTSAAQIHFGDSVMSNTGMIQYWNNTNSMAFATNGGTERMRITSDGTVYVHGQNSGFDGTIRIGERAYIEHRDAGQTTTSIISNYDSDTAKINFKLKGVSDANAQVTILGSGNVGIGTDSPGRKLEVSGITKTAGFQNTDNYIEDILYCNFANGVANQNFDIQFGNTSFWGYIEVEITGAYTNQNTPGKLTKLYAVGTNPSTIYTNESRVSDSLGFIKDNISLGDFRYDNTTGSETFAIRVSHIRSSGNPYNIKVKAFTHGNGANTILNNLTMSSVYTQTALPRNYVYYNDNVGIGDTSPLAKLEVAGSIKVTNSDSGHTSEPGLTMSYVVPEAMAYIETWDSKPLTIRTYNYQAFNISGGEAMRIDTNGNVGIGTTSPLQSNLVVSPSAQSADVDGVTVVYNPDGATNRVRAQLKIDSFQGILELTDSGDVTSTYVTAAGDSYFNGGDVGIGTTTPDRLLELSKSVQNGQGATLRLTNIVGGAGAGVAIEFNGPGSQGIHSKIKTEDLGAFDSNLIFQTKATGSAGALADRMTIDNTGDVGIGTTSPGTKLHVHSANGDGKLRVSGDNILNSGGEIKGFNNGFAFNVAPSGGGTYVERMRINGLGKVGIDVTVPTNQLHVHTATDDAYAIRIEGSTNNGAGVWTGLGIGGESTNTKSALLFEDIGDSYARGKLHLCVNNELNQNSATPADAKLTVSNDGKVGIGATSPLSKLHVSSANSVVTIEATTNGQNCSTWYKANGNNQWETGCNISSGQDYQIYDRLNSASRMVVGHNGNVTIPGNVGIGVTSVSTGVKLEVDGKIASESLRLKDSSATQYLNVGPYASQAYFYGYQSGNTIHFGQPATFVQNIQVQGTATATNFILSSDKTLKNNIKEIDTNHIDVDWKNFELKSEPGVKRAGVIAQELEEKHPEFVRTDDEGIKSVAYIDLLITKIAELEARLEKAGI